MTLLWVGEDGGAGALWAGLSLLRKFRLMHAAVLRRVCGMGAPFLRISIILPAEESMACAFSGGAEAVPFQNISSLLLGWPALLTDGA